MSREETQEKATDVGPVKKKEKKRERERGGQMHGHGGPASVQSGM